MLEYTARRIFIVLPVMLVASLLVFSIPRLVPGDMLLPQIFGGRINITPEQIEREYGLDRPTLTYYFEWVGGIVQGDLGKSIFTGRDVGSEIWKRSQVTVELIAMAFVISQIVGLSTGLISALKRGSRLDSLIRILGSSGMSMPFFWLASLFILGAGLLFDYQPPLRYPSLADDPVANLRYFIAPAALLAIGGSAIAARITRSSVIETLEQDYIRTARSKGLSAGQMLYRHTLWNSLPSVLTSIGPQISFLLVGVFLAEIIFNIPGVGRLGYDAAINRDLSMLQGILLVSVSAYVLINLITDLISAWLDPEIRVKAADQ
jgi:peptide/nickel transport system permease protein